MVPRAALVPQGGVQKLSSSVHKNEYMNTNCKIWDTPYPILYPESKIQNPPGAVSNTLANKHKTSNLKMRNQPSRKIILLLVWMLSLVIQTESASFDKPHAHQGLVSPYEPKAPKVDLNKKAITLLEDGKIYKVGN